MVFSKRRSNYLYYYCTLLVHSFFIIYYSDHHLCAVQLFAAFVCNGAINTVFKTNWFTISLFGSITTMGITLPIFESMNNTSTNKNTNTTANEWRKWTHAPIEMKQKHADKMQRCNHGLNQRITNKLSVQSKAKNVQPSFSSAATAASLLSTVAKILLSEICFAHYNFSKAFNTFCSEFFQQKESSFLHPHCDFVQRFFSFIIFFYEEGEKEACFCSWCTHYAHDFIVSFSRSFSHFPSVYEDVLHSKSKHNAMTCYTTISILDILTKRNEKKLLLLLHLTLHMAIVLTALRCDGKILESIFGDSITRCYGSIHLKFARVQWVPVWIR